MLSGNEKTRFRQKARKYMDNILIIKRKNNQSENFSGLYYNILRFLNINRIHKKEKSISTSMIIQSQNVPVIGRLTFIP